MAVAAVGVVKLTLKFFSDIMLPMVLAVAFVLFVTFRTWALAAREGLNKVTVGVVLMATGNRTGVEIVPAMDAAVLT